MPPSMGNLDYLRPLFQRVAPFHAPSGDIAPWPAPLPRSSLTRDDAQLSGWNGQTLIASSLTAGIGHVDALYRMVVKAKEIDAFSPWTLLRCALENFATAAWLLTGSNRCERQGRAIALWAEDMRNRAQHEEDSRHVITGPNEKSGRARREELLRRGEGLGIPRKALPKTEAGLIIEQAATAAGLNVTTVRATWRVASGFAHGRYWPNLRAGQPTSAHVTTTGFRIGFALDEARHAHLATACDELLAFANDRYRARSGL